VTSFMDDPLTTKGALANFKEGYSPVAPWLRRKRRCLHVALPVK